MTQTSGEQIKQTAREHYLVPLAPAEEVREDGMMLFSHGEGSTLTDVDGKEYLDAMGSGTRATSIGYGQEEIARAVYNQLVGLHYVGTVANQADTVIRLAAKLAELAPEQLNVAFFVGS
ncbi:MAG: aminotransferase class III-fold pyridoxal phosphate-dependent enzyme, partial [Chloroflexi bacterium]|nr:aminotransferase class III-fold pyridoxal phosphate-dependent enzyme [Chloroflexota bacterium]